MVERIKALCKQNKITIQKLEKELGFGNGTIRRWDETKPASEKVSAVASFFGVSVEYIQAGEQKQPSELEGLPDGVINWVKTIQERDELIKLLAAYQNIAPEKRPVYLEILQRGGEHKE